MTRNHAVLSAVLAASLSSSFIAFGQDKKDAGAAAGAGAAAAMPPPPAPSKELENWMKPIDGTWKCDTKMMAGAMGPGSPEMTSKTTVKFSKDKDSNGMWYRGDYTAPKTKTSPEMKGSFLIGYDDNAKQVKSVGWDSMGGASMGTGTMTADTITWTGETMMMGQRMKIRDTMTKTGPKTATHKMEADQGKGFQVMAEDTCTK
jgi:hypothetical protein